MAQEAQAPPREPILVKIPEAAQILTLSRTKVYRLIRENKLPVVRFDSSVRVPLTELRAMIASRIEHGGS